MSFADPRRYLLTLGGGEQRGERERRGRKGERKFFTLRSRSRTETAWAPTPRRRRGAPSPHHRGPGTKRGTAVVCRPTRPRVLPHTRHTGHTSHTTYVGRHATSAHACECTAFRTTSCVQYREYLLLAARTTRDRESPREASTREHQARTRKKITTAPFDDCDFFLLRSSSRISCHPLVESSRVMSSRTSI